MNGPSTKKAFKNVMGLGDIDYEFTINLSEKEAKLYNFDINQTKSLKDCKTLLQNEAVKDKITISSKNNLINLLLFINKTNQTKSFTEFLSINCLFLNQDLAFIKEKIKNEFDENFLFLIESNIISPCKFKLNINVENKEPKSFESEMAESSKVSDGKSDAKTADSTKKADDKSKTSDGKSTDSKSTDGKTTDNKANDSKGADNKGKGNDSSKASDSKTADNKTTDKGADNKTADSKATDNKGKPADNKGADNKTADNKSGDNKAADKSKPADNKNADNKSADNKAADNKTADNKGKPADNKAADNKAADNKTADNKAADNKGKAADNKAADNKAADNKAADNKAADNKGKPADNKAADNKATDNKTADKNKPADNKTADTKKDGAKPKAGSGNKKQINEIKLPEISKPDFENEKESDGVEGNDYVHNLLNKIVYDFANCDYMFIDLNKFLTYYEIDLNNLYDFIYEKIIQQYYNTKIVMVFPGIYKDFRQELLYPLIDLTALADYVIYDKRDAMKVTNLLGYKAEEKNFEARFMFLKEFKKMKFKPQRRALFLDDFNKLTVIAQENETSLILAHDEFNFDVGFKVDYFKAVTNHYEFLKFVFYGGFFSKIVEGKSNQDAFHVGKTSFLKVLDILQTNSPMPDDPDYFVVKDIEKPKKEKVSPNREREKMKSSKSKGNFTAAAPSKMEYTSMSPSRINSSRSSNPLSKSGYLSESSGMNNIIDAEQKKLMTIIQANEKLQAKINQLLSANGVTDSGTFNPSKSMNLNRKLPGLGVSSSQQFSKLSYNNNQFRNKGYGSKKSLKPISSDVYGGYYANPFMSQSLNQDDLRTQMKLINEYNQSNVSQTNTQGSDQQQTSQSSQPGSPTNKSPEKKKIKPVVENPMEKFMKDMEEMTKFMKLQQQFAATKSSQTSSPSRAKSPGPSRHIERQKRELFPVCNLGYIPKPDPEQERIQKELLQKRQFKDPSYWDKKHNKNKFKYLEKQKKQIEEVNKSFEEKGHRGDYDDLNRSMEKEKKREEAEKERIRQIEREKQEKEEKLKREKEAREKEKRDKEQKEKEAKDKALKELEKKDEKKPADAAKPGDAKPAASGTTGAATTTGATDNKAGGATTDTKKDDKK